MRDCERAAVRGHRPVSLSEQVPARRAVSRALQLLQRVTDQQEEGNA